MRNRRRRPTSRTSPTTGPKLGSMAAAETHAGTGDQGTVRADVWIWSVRLTKTRSQAASACRAGHVRVNGERVKPAYAIKPGDEIRLRHAERERVVVLTRVVRKRVGAPVAVQCYVDNSPPPPPREFAGPVAVRERGAGRPTKRERRVLDELKGH
ncbi:RNA-binding S4 domain-containing protein [Streptomyces niveus]|uniref:RNA-binding S4 domain-containing protein n=1 Tax=Streptomyces niveus TaxID=193462 RepID=UPI0036435F9D